MRLTFARFGFALVLAAVFAVNAEMAAAQPKGIPNTKDAAVSPPLWKDLTPAQRKALEPLAAHWNTLNGRQKSKWLTLSRNLDKMTPQQQATLRSRMTEWAALSPQERTRARLNYAQIKHLVPPEEHKAKWEAYQSLSEAEKRKLAEQASTRPPATAGQPTPARPVPAHKPASAPGGSAKSRRAARIETAPSARSKPPAPAPGPARVTPPPP